MLDEQGDVLAAFAERRQAQADLVEPIEEVVAELAFVDHAAQVLAGGRHHADVHPADLVSADRLDLAVLERPQQLGLHGRGHVADLVEEQRASVDHLKEALAVGHRPGERTADVAEQLALQEVLIEGGAVDGSVGFGPPGGVAVNGPGDKFLAGARFAEDQDGQLTVGHPLDHVDDPEHLRVGGDQPLEFMAALGLLGEHPAFPLAASLVRGPGHDVGDRVEVRPPGGRFQHADVALMATGQFRAAPGGLAEQNNLCFRSQLAGAFQQPLDLPVAPRTIGHDHVGPPGVKAVDGFLHAMGHSAGAKLRAQAFGKMLGLLGAGVHDQNEGGLAHERSHACQWGL